ncbi:MAG TPA: PP2C family serine/threonine-protein phosphatase [Pseudonocardiaceae bacterium]|jgi:protein phosphatase|nr:PP2C family serine/threonine-protein phosphatase [Pseudonocardiaceae bacterium]
MTLALRYAARSDRGLVRQNNQDAFWAGPRLLALADGMGGHAAGEVAAKTVIDAFAPLDDDEPGNDLLDQLHEATLAGNAAISELVREDPEREGMGTTLTAVLFAGNKIGLVHVGDSRAYLMRDGALSQITHDDTFVQSLIDEGRISEEEASHHPQRSLLLKALTGHEVEPSLTVREARAGDRYLLCSDGLSGVVSAETLAEGLTILNPQECSDRLIELALKGGGPDNITCIVADVVDVDYGEDAPIIGGAAGDGVEEPQPDSPAARAATTTLPRPEPKRIEPVAPDPQLRRRKQRRRLIALAVLGVLLSVLVATGSILVLGQYYVGATGNGEVAVFRGVRGEVLGLPLHARAEGSCWDGAPRECEPILLRDLEPPARTNVQRGMISSAGLVGAREIIGRLRIKGLLPTCPRPGTGTGSDKPQASSSPSATITPDQPVPTATGPTTTTAAPSGGLTGQHPEPTTTGTSLPEKPLEPGVDCRTVS